MAAYKYRVYGFGIASEVECPELSTAEAPVSARIRYGEVPEALDHCLYRGSYYQIASKQILLVFKGVARCLVSNGSEIVVDRLGSANQDLLRAYLLGSALGALLQQRGLMVLHGSCIRVGDMAVAFLGASGQGKSTLATAFRMKGYPVLADDVTALDLPPEGMPMVLSGPTRVRLLPDAPRMLGLSLPQAVQLAPDGEKILIPGRDEACSDGFTLQRVYVLAKADQNEFQVSGVRGIDSVTHLLENLYRSEFLRAGADPVTLYRQCVQVALGAELYRVAWPRDPSRFARLAGLLESHVTSAPRGAGSIGVTSGIAVEGRVP